MYTVEEAERLKKEVRTAALREAALVADELADSALDEDGVPAEVRIVVAEALKKAARLIRRRELEND